MHVAHVSVSTPFIFSFSSTQQFISYCWDGWGIELLREGNDFYIPCEPSSIVEIASDIKML